MNKLKVMIADNNPLILRQLADTIIEDNQLELVGMADNGRDAYELIETEKPDAVFFDLLLAYYDGFALMDKIHKDSEGESRKLIMTTPLTNDVIIKESCKRGLDYLMVKPYDMEMVSDKIKDVCQINQGMYGSDCLEEADLLEKNKREIFKEHKADNCSNCEIIYGKVSSGYCYERSIDKTISDMLGRIGVPMRLKGYKYIVTAIKEVLNDENVLEGITKVLYPIVAKKHNSTPQRVEKAIRHAIEVTWLQNTAEEISKQCAMFSNVNKSRPTNLEFLTIISQAIRTS